MPVIKRYPNRKLYNTEAKCYVTLEHISRMIRAGADVQVTDHETGEDLTNLTLSQIILEQERKRAGFLPRPLLTSLIRAGGSTLDTVLHAVQAGAGTAKGAGLEERISRLVTRGVLNSEQARAVLQALPPTEEHPALRELDERLSRIMHRLNVPTNQDVQALQHQLSELNAKLTTLLAEKNGTLDTPRNAASTTQAEPSDGLHAL
jgi:polyhydroxyalkanoate synthesis repressor PhaR